MDEQEMREMLLTELIDNMQGRLADKAYPDEVSQKEEKPELSPTEDKKEDPLLDEESPEDMELADALMQEHGV